MVGQNDRSAAEAAVQPQGQEAAVTCAAQEATTGGTSMHQSVGAGESLRAQQDEETGVASSRGTETSPDDLNAVKSVNRGGNEDDSSDDNSSVQVPDNADDDVDDALDKIVMEAVGPAISPTPSLGAIGIPIPPSFVVPPRPVSSAAAAAAAAAAATKTKTNSLSRPQPMPRKSRTEMYQLDDLGFAAPYLQKLAPLRVATTKKKPTVASAASAASAASSSSAGGRSSPRSSPLRIRRGSSSAGVGAGDEEESESSSSRPHQSGTKGSKRFEARWGRQRRPSPPSYRQSSQQGSSQASINEPIPLSRSISAPSTAARAPWRSFRRGSSQAAMAATDASPSWEEHSIEGTGGGRARQDYIEEGYSEDLSSSEDEYDERVDHDFYRRRGSGYALSKVVSDPLHGSRHRSSPTPQSPRSPRSGDSFEDEDDLLNSPRTPQTPHSFDTDSSIRLRRSRGMSSDSDDNSSLDSDTLLDLDLDDGGGMGRLAQELATPHPRPRSRRSPRNLFRSPRSRSTGLSPNGRGLALEGVVEGPNEDGDDGGDEHGRELDLEEGGGAVTDLVATAVVGTAAALSPNVDEPEIETVSTVEGSSPDSSPPQDGRSLHQQDGEPGDDQPAIIPNVSSIQMADSVEYYSYDPEAPLSPPPEEVCPTPLASNMRKNRSEPSLLQLPGPALSSDRSDSPPSMQNTIPIGMVGAAAGTAAVPAATAASSHRWKRRPRSTRSDVPSIVSAADTKSTFMSMFTLITKEHMDPKILLFLSIFSIFGSSLRVYISRMFGFDCEFPNLVGDVFAQGFKNICVTASGRTEQSGGALFIDLPANMLGSALMGVMSSPFSSWPNIPWLRADHPLQRNNAMHIAIRTGLCGTLTTFASWNAQMVVMIDGTGLPLGKQIMPAIFGYILGLQASIACFLFGRKVNVWLNRWKNPDVCVELGGNGRRGRGRVSMFGGRSRIASRGRYRRRSSTDTLRHRNRLGSQESNNRLADVPEDIAIFPSNSKTIPMSDAERKRLKKEKIRRYKEAKYADNASQPGSVRSGGGDHHSIPSRIIVFPTIGDTEPDDLCMRILAFLFSWRTLSLLLVSILFALYVVSDVVWGLQFYRTMWLSVLFTPLGAILRWKLQLLNGGKLCKSRKWLPTGTVIANIVGSLVAIAAVAIETRYTSGDQSSASVHVLAAVKIGFAGSMSTVSSVVKEIVDITERYPSDGKGYSYAFASMTICCALALIVYSPIVRS